MRTLNRVRLLSFVLSMQGMGKTLVSWVYKRISANATIIRTKLWLFAHFYSIWLELYAHIYPKFALKSWDECQRIWNLMLNIKTRLNCFQKFVPKFDCLSKTCAFCGEACKKLHLLIFQRVIANINNKGTKDQMLSVKGKYFFKISLCILTVKRILLFLS